MSDLSPRPAIQADADRTTAPGPGPPFAKADTLVAKTAFYLGLATLFTHELDAIANHEWRIMPILRSLPEEVAYTTFVVLHIPIFAVLIALVFSSHGRVRRISRIGVGVFLLAHAGLHLQFARTAGYEFDSLLSSILIFGGALVGGLYLAACVKQPLPGSSI